MNSVIARSLSALGLVLFLSTISQTASAWTPMGGGRNVAWSGTVQYDLYYAGSDDMSFASLEQEVRSGMDAWAQVDCSSLQTAYAGSTSAGLRKGDRRNTLQWYEGSWAHGSGTVGLTTNSSYGGSILEADIEMNGVHHRWTTGPGEWGSVNTYSIVLHEGGHFMGLGHSEYVDSVMYWQYQGGVAHINADDRAGICTLYPGGGGGSTGEPTDPGNGGTQDDCYVTGCQPGYACISGTCLPDGNTGGGGGGGDGSVCAPCNTNEDCGGILDLCLVYPSGESHCGKSCASDAECGSDATCMGVGYGGWIKQCAGIDASGTASCETSTHTPEPPPTGPTSPAPECSRDDECPLYERCVLGVCEPIGASGGGALGAACDSGDECESGLCLSGECTESCNWLDTRSCGAGFYCDAGAAGQCNEGFCVRGRPGDGASGDFCDVDTDCTSLFCDAGICTTPCQPDGFNTCGPGYACQVGQTPSCGACQMAGLPGEPCGSNDDCASSLCASIDGFGLCTDFCTTNDECVTGFTCEDVTGGGRISICVPPAGYQPGVGGGPQLPERTLASGCACATADTTTPGGMRLSLMGLLVMLLIRRRQR